jgi:glyoxylase-like metal-dependent hydrolase (beta-lactamase superfamily II)
MKFRRIIFIFFILALLSSLSVLRAEEELTIDFERYSERVLIVKCGKIYTDQVIAIATQKGIVMIDTGKAPTITSEYRKIIEREFGRNDFSYVINTHFHFDHTDGNQVFDEAEIIAHESSPERMHQFDRGRQNFVAGRKSQIEQLKIQLKALNPNSEDAQRLRDILSQNPIMLDDLENNYSLTLPTITFNDRMMLDLGDITLKLIYFGQGRHTGDDIIIHCPEEKLLFTGDLFFRSSLQIAFSAQFDAPRWIEVMNELLEDESEIKWVYDTHNGRMPVKFTKCGKGLMPPKKKDSASRMYKTAFLTIRGSPTSNNQDWTKSSSAAIINKVSVTHGCVYWNSSLQRHSWSRL